MSMVVSELVVVQKAQALKEAQATELKLQLVSAQAKVTILMCYLALLMQPYHALTVLVSCLYWSISAHTTRLPFSVFNSLCTQGLAFVFASLTVLISLSYPSVCICALCLRPLTDIGNQVMTLTTASDIDSQELAAAKKKVLHLQHAHSAAVSAAAQRNASLSSEVVAAQVEVEILKKSIGEVVCTPCSLQLSGALLFQDGDPRLQQQLEAAKKKLDGLEKQGSQSPQATFDHNQVPPRAAHLLLLGSRCSLGLDSLYAADLTMCGSSLS